MVAAAPPRVPESKLVGVEAGRGVAACLVVLYHLARHIRQDTGALPFGGLTQFGHAGVDFFFVLSGFIILHVHWADIGRSSRAVRYALRRAIRVFPLYWIVLAATLAQLLEKRAPLPGSGTLLRDLVILPYGDLTLGVAWTLQHEMLFYAVFLVLILSRTLGLAALGAWAALLALACLFPDAVPAAVPPVLTSAFCLQFFMGMGAAILLRRAAPPRPLLLLAAGLLGFLAAGAAEDAQLLDGYATPARFAYGLPATLALVGLVAAERAGELSIPRFAAGLGSGSYAIYLTHLLLIGAAWRALGAVGLGPAVLPPAVAFLLIASGCIAAGVLVARYVEQPLLRRIRARLLPRPPPALAADRTVSTARA